MSRRPDSATSNYGWALWHLEQAECPDTSPQEAAAHAQMAQARATLALVDQQESQQYGDDYRPPEFTTWSGVTDER